MSKKYITVGVLISLIFAIILFIWVMSLSSDVSNNPSDPKTVEKVADKMVEETIPIEVNVLTVLAPSRSNWYCLIYIVD
jgi:YbbR domain-containing protein